MQTHSQSPTISQGKNKAQVARERIKTNTLVESNVKVNRFNAVVWFFASATPAGIFLGFAISAIASSVISSAATALASGTFMYVAMMVSRRRAGLLFPGLGMHHNFTSSTRGC